MVYIHSLTKKFQPSLNYPKKRTNTKKRSHGLPPWETHDVLLRKQITDCFATHAVLVKYMSRLAWDDFIQIMAYTREYLNSKFNAAWTY